MTLQTEHNADARLAFEPLVRRGQVIHVPITVTLEAFAQDNGDGTWTVTVPDVTNGTATGPSLDIALRRMADALSWIVPA